MIPKGGEINDREKGYQSWTISDELWEAVKEAIPKKERDAKKTYKNKPGQGRKPMNARKALGGILYVLRTGCQWKALPKEYGSGSAVHRHFQEWGEAGFLRNSGHLVWKNMMNWKESAGSGKAWTGVW